jgi:nitrous oxidase accessory protein NosD
MELDGTFREGQTYMDSVEIVYGGQKDTRSAAIRFEGAVAKSQVIKNCAVHEGPGWMVNGLRSKNLKFENNVFWGGNQVGVGFNSVMSTKFNSNFVGWVTPRNDLEAIGMATLDVMGGALFCSLTWP